ncbi:MAG TPA: carboxypeptidase-like regulatory domain-containing protein [Bryobacteraceae bacterium]|nr:carboxypeptidase-like regulatory domain-containing protein [Bryobacteraceae bacterium]
MPLLLSMLLIAFALPAFSQTLTTGDVAGVIKDATGAVVPNATVTLKSVDTGDARTGVTNASGEYRFDLLKPGQYEVSAASTGLKSNVQKFGVLVGQVATMDLMLNVTATQSVVTVEAQAATLQTENADLETGFTSKQIVDLPMPGGDLTTLAMTVPGIRVNVTGGSANMNANGIPGTSIQFTLNGMDENDPANNYNNSGASNNLLGANEVGEAAVVLNAYSPQYGHMAGAQVNLLGKSGTNQFHGNLFYNYNFEKLNANAFFANATDTPRGRSDAHNFGGSIGGPILKNKLFGFFDIEELRYVLPGSGVASLPSPQLQAYTLAHVPASTLPLYQDLFNLLKSAPGYNRAIPVSNGSGLLQDSLGHLGCGSGTFTGTPTGTGGTFGVDTPCAVAFGTNNNELNTEQYYTIRTDYNVNDKQKMFFRFNRDNGVQATGISPVNPAFNAVSYQPQYQGGVSHTYVFTPALVNNFTGSVLWYQARFGVADFSKTTALMPEAIQLNDGGANGGGFPTFGASVYPNGFAVGRNVGHIQLNDDLSWTKGAHTFRVGVAYRRDRYNYSSIAQNAFVGQYALNDVADFANGVLDYNTKAALGSSFSQSYPLYGALHFHVPSAEIYAGDEWAITKSLKLTYGVRFEDNMNPSCVEKCFVLLNTPFDSPTYQGGVTVPYNTTVATQSNLFYRTDGVIPEPRIGIAWKPFGNDKTVIRSGFGLFTTNYTDGTAGTFANQIPNKFAPSGLTTGSIGLAADPTTAAFTAQQSANAFFTGFNAGYTLAQLKSAVAPASFSTPSFASEPAVYHTPHDVEWNFEIQHAFTPNNVFSVNYVGNHGYDLSESVNANMYTGASGVTRYGGTYAGLPTAAPDGRFVTVTQYFNDGVSRFNALELTFRHTYTWGLTAQFHYTWSHALGTIAFENPFNLNGSYGNLGFDNRHQFAGDFAWTQNHKVDNKVLNALAKGWTVAGKVYVYSGAPFSVTDSKIPSQVNSAGGVLTPLADVVSGGALSANCGSAVNAPCLQRTQFATYASTSGVASPIQTDWGNISPNSFYGPGYFDIDTTFSRNFAIKERMAFNFGIQAYNLLNHANFANPSGSISSGSFGLTTTTLGPPTSIYGSGQGASVSGRVVVLMGRFTF